MRRDPLLLAVLLVCTLFFSFRIELVGAADAIYIRADGSIDPPTANIMSTDNITYYLTNEVWNDIIVERSNIVFDGAGYEINGVGIGPGINLTDQRNVTITNMSIGNFQYCIYLFNSHNNTLSANYLRVFNGHNIGLCNSSNNRIIENYIIDGGTGIGLYNSSNYNVISGNQITLHVRGIYSHSSSHNKIEVNNIEDNGYGIFLHSYSNHNGISRNNLTKNRNTLRTRYSNNNNITENIIKQSEMGIWLQYSSSHNRVIRNNISADYGIFLWHASNDNILSENSLSNGDIGVWLNNSSDYNNIVENSIDKNRDGVAITYSSNNSVYHNNFVNNTNQASEITGYSNVWDDSYPSGGNYWSNYNGIDLRTGPFQNVSGSDGMGDTPYIISGNHQDNYPLMKAYPWASRDLGITGCDTSKTIVGQGYNMEINITMFNYGNVTENFEVTLYGNESLLTSQAIDLEMRHSTTVIFIWNTSTFPKGNLALTAHIEPVPDEIDTVDNTLFDGWIFVTIPGDVDGDKDVDIFDIVVMAVAYGSENGDLRFHLNYDIEGDGDIDNFDIAAACSCYGENW